MARKLNPFVVNKQVRVNTKIGFKQVTSGAQGERKRSTGGVKIMGAKLVPDFPARRHNLVL